MEINESKLGGGESNPQSREKLNLRVLRPGEGFGNFQVVKCLCDGLIANYYHMQHIRDLRDVTVGIFHERVGQDMGLLKRLQALQKTVKGFDHEGIPKITECAQINGRICIFLEPVGGQSLSQYFESHAVSGQEGVDAEATMRILAQLLGLLGYAHSHGIDHRDIDSDMVFIQEDGSLRLLGLGVKAVLGTEHFEAIVSASVSPLASSNTHNRLNSFDVMSPEYQSGIPEDSRVDLFCAGFIGYWLITGRKPNRKNPERPTSLVENLSPKWDNFLLGLLKRERDERVQSCRIALHVLKEEDWEPESKHVGFVQRQIDWIPVPKRILDQGEYAARIFRLTFIGIVGLILCALAAFFMQASFIEDKDYRKSVAMLVADGQVPQLVVEVRPPVAKIEFSGSERSFVTNNGRLELKVIPGEYKLRVSAPQHVDIFKTVTILERMRDGPQRIAFDLLPAWTNLKIRTEPGASVSAVNELGEETGLGLADDEGNLVLQKTLLAGTYQVVVKKEGFESIVMEDQKLEAGEVADLEIALSPLTSSLTIHTAPPGARIFIDDIEVGRSPMTLDQVKASEAYRIEAQLENYRAKARQIELAPGQDMLVNLGELTPKSAALEVAASFERLSGQDAKALLGETEVVLGELRYPYGATALKMLPEGDYAIHLEHPLYLSAVQELSLRDGDRVQLSFVLTPRPGQVRLILPEGVKPEIRLNDQKIDWQGGLLPIPANQIAQLELRVRDYLTMRSNLQLKPNQVFDWNVRLVPIPGPEPGQDWTVPYLGFQLAWIPPGAFTMGSPIQEQGRLPNEGEQTEVHLTQGFWAGVHEVTQAEFRGIMDRTPSEFTGARHPADRVTWVEAQAFCRALTAIEEAAGRLPEGYVYRLPTEAEWEYAARAGTTTPFHFGEQADTTYGNFRGAYPRELDAATRATRAYGTEPVGTYPPNAFGLYDVHGNVSEWTLDAYNGRLPGGQLTDPKPRSGGERYTLRGGSWEDSAVRVRSAARSNAGMSIQINTIGFRIFLAPSKSKAP
ncbi:MAG: SUMF1/EgtB/PvdO family nonheme iron enzyme [Opitutales bacterium]